MNRSTPRRLGFLAVGLWLSVATACGDTTPTSPTLPTSSVPTPAPTPVVSALLRAETPTTPGLVRRPSFPPDDYAQDRHAMVNLQIGGRGVIDPEVLRVLRRVPRHLFVPDSELSFAYADSPLPIGHGQTISQPYIVGYMTEILRLTPRDHVLEIGTGSGYQAAILAELVERVVSIEIVGELARSAAERLQRLGYSNVTVLEGDGYFGYAPGAPYDAIIVTAAAEHVPPPLLAQLKPGGRMAIPVGRTGWTQNLLLVEKRPDGSILTHNLLPVRFVPLTRDSP